MKRLSPILISFVFLLLLVLGACTETSNIFESPVKPTPPEEEFPYDTNPVEEIAYAFPGVQGGGQNTTGGRGGQVYVVSSLEDDEKTPGTLRHAIAQSGPRIIVFSVSGTIHLKSRISIKNGDLTIAGQTAPGDGICLADYYVDVDASNVIIRYLRFRMGDLVSDLGADGADALGGRKQQNVVIDHCSVSWSTDECCSFYDNKNFTMQWCIISESLRLSGHSKGPHGYGAIWGGVNATFHHNLMAHHDSRTPRFGAGAMYVTQETVDFRNNVLYNWSGNGCYGGEGMSINIVNNYYKPGPATDNKVSTRIMAVDINTNEGGDFAASYMKPGKYYVSGNYFPNSTSVSTNNWEGMVNNTGFPVEDIKASSSIDVDPVITIRTAQEAYEKVLQYAGCVHRRDEIDTRIVEETRNGTATFKGLSEYNGVGGDWKSQNYPKLGIIDSQNDLRPDGAGADWSAWPELVSEEAPLDTDGDGMPDEWEIAHGLNPEKYDANGRHLSTGYDNIEVYINSLVQDITEAQDK